MRIINFQLRKIMDFNWKTIDLNSDTCILFSDENSTGKTTLMRALLYTFGFGIPSTELVKFEKYEFKLKVSIEAKEIDLYRKGAYFQINNQEYDLPVEQLSAHTFLFGIKNMEILTNLLGVIYFDQEKGWTLLNRGTIIGTNHFSIESFFRGLKEDESKESYEMVATLRTLRKKIAQYNLMLNVAEYQSAINEGLSEKFDYTTYDEELEISLGEKQMQLLQVESELQRLSEMIKTNKNFSDYIEKKKIFVKNPIDGTPIPVNKATLLEYQTLMDVNEARRDMLIANRNALKKQIAEIESKQQKQLSLVGVVSADEELTARLASIKGISSVQVKAVLKDLKKQKSDLEKLLNTKTKQGNPWVDRAYKIIAKYTEEMGISFDYKIDIFTHNLKEKSGAILHKMVFAYKLAYIKLLSEKIGYKIPIFCDSPSGREVEKKTVDDMLRILYRDFSEHQIIIASIYKYENVVANAKIIAMNGTLFDGEKITDVV